MSSTKGSDVLVGAVIGLAGGGVVKAVLKSVAGGSYPAIVDQTMPASGAIVAGLVAWALLRKKHPDRARGYLVGASVAGVAASAWPMLQQQFPQLQDLVSVRMSNYGLIVRNRPFGMLVPDGSIPGRFAPGQAVAGMNPNLQRLASVQLQNMASSPAGRAALGNIAALVQRRAMRQ